MFQLSPKWNVKEIKKQVAPKIGMKAEEFSIIFAGKCLSDSLLLEVRWKVRLLYLFQIIPFKFKF